MVQHDVNGRLNPSEETIQVGPTRLRFLVTSADSNGGVTLFEATIPAGTALAGLPHSHDAFEEAVYGVAGVSTWTVDGELIEVRPGQALCISRGAVHQFANHGDMDARVVAVLTPAVLGPKFFREAAAVVAAANGEPPDHARMAEVMRRHGLTPAPPSSTS